MILTQKQLLNIMPRAGARASYYIVPLNAAMERFGITTPLRAQMFIAQVAHESGELQYTVENLNYSALGLCQTWPKRFAEHDANGKAFPSRPNQLAVRIARNAEAIANYVYANRMGNGDSASGDGWAYRGRGLIQLTGRDNYVRAAAGTGRPYVAEPALVAEPDDAAMTAAWFWDANGLSNFADKNDFDGVCDAINVGRKTEAIGDSIGYKERLAYFKRAQQLIP
jgi:putative chitinase